ncbi:hypothetical protein CC86DRAFT_467706 [Ophiobolus disseminans]|uniref:J domain-containing protein n=1 Tax=Ophiobolus disseminans TaxID=1469910 RepID=A0A6A6ZXZ6_9PLEO|nr:hypothetical protein CC86DRAFT_467706 [Ophiobolus disseminans]
MDSPSILARFPTLTALFSQARVHEEAAPVQPARSARSIRPVRPVRPAISQPHVPPPRKTQKKRKHTFEIFKDAIHEDETAATVREGPAPKHYIKSRLPLKVRTDVANSAPATPFVLPDTPRPSPTEEDKENHDPAPAAPPVPYVSTVTPMPPASPPPALPAAAIIDPNIWPTEVIPLPEPRNMVLYVLLGLTDWTVTSGEIFVAWRRTALRYHPDRHAEEDHLVATLEMQKLNAAKEVLTDMSRRRHYHRTGVLPLDV